MTLQPPPGAVREPKNNNNRYMNLKTAVSRRTTLHFILNVVNYSHRSLSLPRDQDGRLLQFVVVPDSLLALRGYERDCHNFSQKQSISTYRSAVD